MWSSNHHLENRSDLKTGEMNVYSNQVRSTITNFIVKSLRTPATNCQVFIWDVKALEQYMLINYIRLLQFMLQKSFRMHVHIHILPAEVLSRYPKEYQELL